MELIRLRIEMYEDFLTDEEKVNIKKHLKTSNDFKVVRDVIVFGDMRLNNLHFLIQKLYNFQGYHLRSFSLSNNDLIRATNNLYKNYKDLLGTIFQAPNMHNEDLYWNDDYDESISFNKYLKNKYTKPYYYGGKFDEPYYAKALFDETVSLLNKEVDDSFSINDAKALFKYDIDFNLLSENMRVEEVFIRDITGNGPLAKEIDYVYDFGANHTFKIKYMKNYSDLKLEDNEIVELKQRVIDKNGPICIYAKGLAITEDGGNMASFSTNLEESKSYAKDELEEFENWLKYMGFKRTIGNIKTIL